MTDSLQNFFATAPKGVEPLLANELIDLGALNVKLTRSGVAFQGDLAMAYKACLWLRTANRVLFPIAHFVAASPEELYDKTGTIDWNEHLDATGSLAVDFNTSGSAIRHSQFGAQKVKDAIVDQFRSCYGIRPSVDLKTPDLRINVYLHKNEATISIDLSGESLHRRGYRPSGVEAPLKENLAAAILIRAGWPAIAESGGGLIDPMCGSGTIPIEAALMAAKSAPGLMRQSFGFLKWKRHRPSLWERLLDEAEQSEIEGLVNLPFIVGYDANPKAIASAHAGCEKAGLTTKIHFERKEFATCSPHPKMKATPGLVLFNPPYGIRLGEIEELLPLYSKMGTLLKHNFTGWKASVFTGNDELGKKIGIRPQKKYAFFNGAIPCTLLNFSLEQQWYHQDQPSTPNQAFAIKKQSLESGEIAMFANRIHKNLKGLKKWAEVNKIQCFRIYDKDIPEFAVSVDLYGKFAHVQEYKAPDTVDPKKAEQRLKSMMAALPTILELSPIHVFLKIRQKQTGSNQYQKRQSSGEFHEVIENNCRFLVNFTDYLDTGLFLDHRSTRELIGSLAAGKRFLNLFSYTGTATVYAALNGAKATTSVDSSKHYNSWAKRNLALNGFSDTSHQIHQSDCLEWIQRQSKTYDLIFLDPPTFSNSKDRQTVFDIQKDHVPLILHSAALLAKNGTLIFSNNFRKFKMDLEGLKSLNIEDITSRTIPLDFKRNPKIHSCWIVKKP